MRIKNRYAGVFSFTEAISFESLFNLSLHINIKWYKFCCKFTPKVSIYINNYIVTTTDKTRVSDESFYHNCKTCTIEKLY